MLGRHKQRRDSPPLFCLPLELGGALGCLFGETSPTAWSSSVQNVHACTCSKHMRELSLDKQTCLFGTHIIVDLESVLHTRPSLCMFVLSISLWWIAHPANFARLHSSTPSTVIWFSPFLVWFSARQLFVQEHCLQASWPYTSAATLWKG